VSNFVELAGKTALITGAAKRIGAATAQALAAAGATAVLHYRDSAAEAEALAQDIQKTGGAALTVQADFSNPASAEALFEEVRQLAGRIDFLINNASIFRAQEMNDVQPHDFYENININALAPFILARAFAKQGRPGAIINLLDTRIASYDNYHFAYHLSKRMLADITRAMALEFAPQVRVNAVAPGVVLPPEGEDTAYLERLSKTNPLQTHGSAEEVAQAICFLLQSPFITGQILYIDGGRHLKGTIHG